MSVRRNVIFKSTVFIRLFAEQALQNSAPTERLAGMASIKRRLRDARCDSREPRSAGRLAHQLMVLLCVFVAVGCRHVADAKLRLPVAGPSIKAGDEREIASLKLCWCPPGHFRMGSPPDEPNRRDDEGPVEVTLSKGFWMGKYEVTQGEWKRVMGAIPGELTAGKGDDFPVYWINFTEAEEFCRRMTERARAAGKLPMDWEFRLPTEAQWEYACRAGTTTAFASGKTLTSKQANIGKPYNGTPDPTPGATATKVGSYPANAWRLHDMHGNEFEWCRDWYHAQLPGGIDPDLYEVKGAPNRDGTYSRVRRGGAWTDDPKYCRSALRLRYEPPRRADHIGFRVAVVQR